jgi:hypothetical protein
VHWAQKGSNPNTILFYSSQNAGKKLPFYAAQNPNKIADLIYNAEEAQNHTQYKLVLPHFHIPGPKRVSRAEA